MVEFLLLCAAAVSLAANLALARETRFATLPARIRRARP
jgi:hypothetical protein